MIRRSHPPAFRLATFLGAMLAGVLWTGPAIAYQRICFESVDVSLNY